MLGSVVSRGGSTYGVGGSGYPLFTLPLSGTVATRTEEQITAEGGLDGGAAGARWRMACSGGSK